MNNMNRKRPPDDRDRSPPVDKKRRDAPPIDHNAPRGPKKAVQNAVAISPASRSLPPRGLSLDPRLERRQSTTVPGPYPSPCDTSSRRTSIAKSTASSPVDPVSLSPRDAPQHTWGTGSAPPRPSNTWRSPSYRGCGPTNNTRQLGSSGTRVNSTRLSIDTSADTQFEKGRPVVESPSEMSTASHGSLNDGRGGSLTPQQPAPVAKMGSSDSHASQPIPKDSSAERSVGMNLHDLVKVIREGTAPSQKLSAAKHQLEDKYHFRQFRDNCSTAYQTYMEQTDYEKEATVETVGRLEKHVQDINRNEKKVINQLSQNVAMAFKKPSQESENLLDEINGLKAQYHALENNHKMMEKEVLALREKSRDQGRALDSAKISRESMIALETDVTNLRRRHSDVLCDVKKTKIEQSRRVELAEQTVQQMKDAQDTLSNRLDAACNDQASHAESITEMIKSFKESQNALIERIDRLENEKLELADRFERTLVDVGEVQKIMVRRLDGFEDDSRQIVARFQKSLDTFKEAQDGLSGRCDGLDRKSILIDEMDKNIKVLSDLQEAFQKNMIELKTDQITLISTVEDIKSDTSTSQHKLQTDVDSKLSLSENELKELGQKFQQLRLLVGEIQEMVDSLPYRDTSNQSQPQNALTNGADDAAVSQKVQMHLASLDKRMMMQHELQTSKDTMFAQEVDLIRDKFSKRFDRNEANLASFDVQMRHNLSLLDELKEKKITSLRKTIEQALGRQNPQEQPSSEDMAVFTILRELASRVKMNSDQHDAVSLSLSHLQMRYNNITTNDLHDSIIESIQRMYPAAPGFLQRAQQIEQDHQGLVQNISRFNITLENALQDVRSRLNQMETHVKTVNNLSRGKPGVERDVSEDIESLKILVKKLELASERYSKELSSAQDTIAAMSGIIPDIAQVKAQTKRLDETCQAHEETITDLQSYCITLNKHPRNGARLEGLPSTLA